MIRATVLLVVVVTAACSTRQREEPAPSKDVAAQDPGAAQGPRSAPDESNTRWRSQPAPFLAGASRVVAFRAGKHWRIAAAGPGFIRVASADGEVLTEAKATGDAQVLETFDVDGDGRPELVVGRGETNRARGAPASLAVLRTDALDRPETIELFSTTRAQIVGVAAASGRPGDLYVAAFDSKYFARIVRARRDASGQWSTEPVTRVRVPGQIASLPDGRLAVARIYGDTDEDPGDLRVGVGDGAVEILTTGGVRAVMARGDRLIYADGWDRNYGRKARALLTVAGPDGKGGWTSRQLAHVPGRYTFDRLRAGDTDGDGSEEVIAAGYGPPVIVPLAGPNMGQVTTLGDIPAADAYPADLDGDGADEVIAASEPPSIWRREADPAR